MVIKYEKQFDKAFKKLLPKIRDKFFERVEGFIKNKFDTVLGNHPVDKAYPGCRSIDIAGDYRAIFVDEGSVVTFVTIGTHAQLYK